MYLTGSFKNTYIVGEEADGNPYDENGPEDVKTLQHREKTIEEVVAKEGLVDGHGVHPSAVDDPA